jgi:hypothetical protein
MLDSTLTINKRTRMAVRFRNLQYIVCRLGKLRSRAFSSHGTIPTVRVARQVPEYTRSPFGHVHSQWRRFGSTFAGVKS